MNKNKKHQKCNKM